MNWLKLALDATAPTPETVVPTPAPAEDISALSALFAQAPEADWRDLHAERAAVVLHDGEVPAAYADAFSMLQVRCPENVPVQRWALFFDDAGRFFDAWGAEAARLGWTAEDLLGLHPAAPLARYDRMGALWLAQGEPIIALDAETATYARGLKFRRPALT